MGPSMNFFGWLHNEYGMALDIYAFDAGAVDAPSYYGSPNTRKFEGQFPAGFDWVADLRPTELPTDWAALYEATCFAANNNAMELRSLERSGPSKIPAVKMAREAFLKQPLMTSRGLSDRYLFDDDPATVFATTGPGKDLRIGSPDRAPSYPAIPWENPVRSRDAGYTYFFPLDESMVGKSLEVVLLDMKGGGQKLQPSVWITARDLPFSSKRLRRQGSK